MLTEAEKILRDSGKFIESISSFDYDGDGFNEYICRMQNYFGCINLLGGALQELEVINHLLMVMIQNKKPTVK